MTSPVNKESHNSQPDSPRISRRDLIKGLGIGAIGSGLGLGLNVVPIAAQSSSTMDSVVALYRFHLGELEVTVMQDGAIGFPPPFLAVNAPEEDVVALLQENSLGAEFAPLSVGIALIKSGERLVLMDTGSGTTAFTTDFFGDNIGHLVPTLTAMGVSPEDITDVIHSHYHPDHLGGTSLDGNLIFPNAQHYLPQIEWDFIQSDVNDEFLAPFVAFANQQLQPLVDNDGQLAFYGDEDEIVSGIQAIETLGHSAGHHSFVMESNGQQLLLSFDVFPHQILHLRHPEWFAGVDQIPDVAVATRQALLARVADEQIPVLTFHFPFPGIGNIVRDGDAFRFIPTS